VLGLFGLAFAAYVWFGLLRMQDRRPARDIEAPELGRTFEVRDVFDKPAALITVQRGERQNERSVGGDRADRDHITLFVTYRAFGDFFPSDFDWHLESPGMDTFAQHASMSLTPDTPLGPGQTATGTVSFYDAVAGSPATITYQGTFDEEPLYTLVVAP
jgi:hypothetical protein